MRKLGFFAIMAAFCCGAQASWYWPFGSSEGVDERPRRISELIEPASLLIDEAADLAADGKTDESIEKYRKALEELDRIELENPERSKSAEFATLRNKRAYVNAAIDSMLLSQVQSNARAVAVSDTAELEKRLDRERWGKRVDKAADELSRCNSDRALAELDKARAGTTNAVLRAITDEVAAGARCQKGAFGEARRALARSRQALARAGELTDEERRLVSAVLQTLRSNVVTGFGETCAAGRRVCGDAAGLAAMDDLTTTNAVALANGVVASLGTMQGRLSVLAFPSARNLNRVSSNLWLRASKLLGRMSSVPEDDKAGKAPKWNLDLSAFEAALEAFEALSPEIKGVDAGVSAVLETLGGEKEKETAGDAAAAEASDEADSKADKSGEKKANPPAVRDAPVAQVEKGVARSLTKREQAMAAISKGDFAAAERLVGELLAEKPDGAAALNLKAALEARQGKFKEAEETLDRAIRLNPRSHFAYYNMANLLLQIRPEDKLSARLHYDAGRSFGGPVDDRLEEALK